MSGVFLIVRIIADKNTSKVAKVTYITFVNKNSCKSNKFKITPNGVFKLWYCIALDTPILSIAIAYTYTDKNQSKPLIINISIIGIDNDSLHIPVILKII